MATATLPIQTLSADVQFDAACAQIRVIRLQQPGIMAWLQVLRVGYNLGKLVQGERALLNKLQGANFSEFGVEAIKDLASDLDRIVSLTSAVVERAHELPPTLIVSLRARLDAVHELASNFDSIAESLHAEADQECMELLSIAAGQVM